MMRTITGGDAFRCAAFETERMAEFFVGDDKARYTTVSLAALILAGNPELGGPLEGQMWRLFYYVFPEKEKFETVGEFIIALCFIATLADEGVIGWKGA